MWFAHQGKVEFRMVLPEDTGFFVLHSMLFLGP